MNANHDVSAQVATLACNEGSTSTPLDGVQLFRASRPVARTAAVYSPSLCIITSGAKRAYLEGRVHEYGAGTYLCAAIPVPIEAELPQATPEEPVTGLLVSLESRTMTELLVELRSVTPEPAALDDVAAGMTVTRWDDTFAAALGGVLGAMADPIVGDVLGRGRLRELLYAAATGPAGAVIRRHIGRAGGDIGDVLAYIRDHLAEPLSVDDLAAQAGLSRAAFDRHFKSATTLSPLRYVKALKLNDAAARIAGGADIAGAAAAVGYVSASQFSRDFKRHIGMAPRDWARTQASHLAPQAAVT